MKSVKISTQQSNPLDNGTFVHTLTKDVKLQEYSSIKFVNSTPLSNIFQTSTNYIDYKIPAGFNAIHKTNELTVEMEVEVTKTIGGGSQNLFLSSVASPSGFPANTITLTSPNNTVTRASTLPATSINVLNDNFPSIFSSQPVQQRYLEGTYSFTNITVTSNHPTANGTQVRVKVGYYNPVTNSYTFVSSSAFVNIPSSPHTFNTSVAVTRTLLPEKSVLAVACEFQNVISNPAITDVSVVYNNLTPSEVLLNRTVTEYFNIQNVPLWVWIDRIQILLNGSVKDEIDQTNYFCEMSLWDRERLRLNAKTMLYDEETYGISQTYPASILVSGINTTVSNKFTVKLPIYSTFLQSSNFMWPMIRDQITVRVFCLPYSQFRISSISNQASTFKLLSTSLNMGGPKYNNLVLMALRNSLSGSVLQSPCYLRKYGFNLLLPQQDANVAIESPINGNIFYDLSYLNGKFLSLWTFLYPENIIGGENRLQYVLNYDSTNVSNDIYPAQLPNVQPALLSPYKSNNFLLNNSFVYTPNSAYTLNRVNLVNNSGKAVFENLNIAEFFRNLMSQQGNSSDFLKTYAIYPFVFSNKIIEDYKTGVPKNGMHEIIDIYNIDLILGNVNSSKLQVRNSGNVVQEAIYNRLYVNGLMGSTCIINNNGKIYFEGL